MLADSESYNETLRKPTNEPSSLTFKITLCEPQSMTSESNQSNSDQPPSRKIEIIKPELQTHSLGSDEYKQII